MIVLKAKFTDKDGKPLAMPWRRVQMSTGQKVRFFGAEIGFNELQMLVLGNYGVQVIKDRVSRGIGSNDAPMSALKLSRKKRWSQKHQKWVEYGEPDQGYAKIKRAAGQPAIRNLMLTGKMLGDFSVRSVSASEVRMDITTNESRMKARTNEIRAPWWGWSAGDLVKLVKRSRELFGDMVQDIGATMAGRFGQLKRTAAGGWEVLRGGKYTTSQPIWMNPWGKVAPKSLDAASMPALRVRIKSGTIRPRRRKAA